MKSLEEIEVEFRNQIKVPDIKPKKQFFFCPAGFMGSGKTTITKKIADHFNLVRISNDELRLILRENGHDFSSLKDIILRVCKEFVEQGFSLAFDMNCANPVTKEKIDQFSKELNIPTIWVHINPPEEFIINSIKSRDNVRIFDSAEHAMGNYFDQKKKFRREFGKIEYDYTTDPSKNNPEVQMKELASIIESKML